MRYRDRIRENDADCAAAGWRMVSSGDKRRIRMQVVGKYKRAASRGVGLDDALHKSLREAWCTAGRRHRRIGSLADSPMVGGSSISRIRS